MNKDIYRDQLHTHQWKMTRERIIHQSFGICAYCKQPDNFLQVHHVKYIGDHPSDTPDEHLRAICRRCHDLKHWTDRLSAYAERKRELYEMGVVITPEIHEKLINLFEV